MLTDYINSLFGEDDNHKDDRDTTALVSPRGVSDEQAYHTFQESIIMSGLVSVTNEVGDSLHSRNFHSTSSLRDGMQSRLAALSMSLDSLPLHNDVCDSAVYGHALHTQDSFAGELKSSVRFGLSTAEDKPTKYINGTLPHSPDHVPSLVNFTPVDNRMIETPKSPGS